MSKPLKAKPQFYANCFLEMKNLAQLFGYNLVIHGSVDRDMDLIAIPWAYQVKPAIDMVNAMVEYLGGHIMEETEEARERFAKNHHGRRNFVINLNRGGKTTSYEDPQWYIDLSITPTIEYKEELDK